MRRRLGLIVNPLAGIGGRVGLKGSDGAATVAEALTRGGVATAPERAVLALQALAPCVDGIDLVTAPFEMGESEARRLGFSPTVVGSGEPGSTTAADTRAAARAMAASGVDLLLFVGGDGTAADVLAAADRQTTVLGVPAGVKMHSGV